MLGTHKLSIAIASLLRTSNLLLVRALHAIASHAQVVASLIASLCYVQSNKQSTQEVLRAKQDQQQENFAWAQEGGNRLVPDIALNCLS